MGYCRSCTASAAPAIVTAATTTTTTTTVAEDDNFGKIDSLYMRSCMTTTTAAEDDNFGKIDSLYIRSSTFDFPLVMYRQHQQYHPPHPPPLPPPPPPSSSSRWSNCNGVHLMPVSYNCYSNRYPARLPSQRTRAMTSCLSFSRLWLGEIESLICNFCISVVAGKQSQVFRPWRTLCMLLYY